MLGEIAALREALTLAVELGRKYSSSAVCLAEKVSTFFIGSPGKESPSPRILGNVVPQDATMMSSNEIDDVFEFPSALCSKVGVSECREIGDGAERPKISVSECREIEDGGEHPKIGVSELREIGDGAERPKIGVSECREIGYGAEHSELGVSEYRGNQDTKFGLDTAKSVPVVVPEKKIFLIRYDSCIAMSLVLGLDKAKRDDVDDIVAECQALMLEAFKFFSVKMAHVKGHSGAEGNNNADENAELGKSGKFSDSGTSTRTWQICDEWDMAELELIAQRVGRSRQFGSSHTIPAINDCTQPVTLSVDDDARKNLRGDVRVDPPPGNDRVGHVEVGHLAAGHLESDLAEDPIPPPVTSVQLEKNSRECYNERVRKDREVRAAVCDGGLWNCNGVAGKEGQIEDFISSKNLGFIVLVEPKQSAASWLASKSSAELELFN